ncbi:hypothetical protein ROA7450_03369 [Roseovarius albus]|uniref:Uncharacterized protein n=1 Tax=Roseovarius albus TaxID=1247867 RepID=A0A1X6ZWW4_9RHOB|nr:hypothetical protein [Roseovarius albus]SLN64002.1 hypothetical protein ROA7450_03369 [Roseovarius albus]
MASFPRHIDPEAELSCCELELEDLERDGKLNRWVAIIVAVVFFGANNSLHLFSDTAFLAIFIFGAALAIIADIKAEIKLQSIQTRAMIAQSHLATEHMAHLRYDAADCSAHV